MMWIGKSRLPAALVVALLLAAPCGTQVVRAADAGTEVVLHSMSQATDGFSPTDLAQLPNGTLYGFSYDGPASNSGPENFSITPGGTFTTLSNFCTNSSTCPLGVPSGLVAGPDGNLYTATGDGGANFDGAFLQVTPAGVITKLYDFSSVTPYPSGTSTGISEHNLILGSDGNLYGTAQLGDHFTLANASGGLYKISSGGAFSLLYAFTALDANQENADGAKPQGALLQAADGNFYGTAFTGGANATGTVFELTPAGVFNVLFTFDPPGSGSGNGSGSFPVAGLMQGADGNFYGTTFQGGSHNLGTLFMITNTPAHTFTKLHDFGGTSIASLAFSGASTSVPAGQMTTLTWNFSDAVVDSANPAHLLVLGNDGNIYGSLHQVGFDPGLVFEITPTGTYTVLHRFGGQSVDVTGNPITDGSQALGLVLGVDGNFYGTTQSGGTEDSGTLYKISVSPAPATTPCVASGAWSGTQAPSGNLAVSQATAGNYTYTLKCTGASGSVVTQSVLVTVTAALAQPTAVIAANPTSITLGQSSTLTWSSTNATSCTGSGAWSGSLAASGTQAVTPAAAGSDTYTLTCSGASGTTAASASTALVVNAPPLPTAALSVNPGAITLGESVTLTWSSANATSCTSSGAWAGSIATSGTEQSMPAQVGSSVYTLTCVGPGGSVTASATATVTAAPPPPTLSMSVSPTAITAGQSATLTWSSSNAASCAATGAWSGAQSTAGSALETPAIGADTYTLTCTGSSGTVAAAATVDVTAPVPTVTVMSGKAGGGGSIGWGSLLALASLLLLKLLDKTRLPPCARLAPAAVVATSVALALTLTAPPLQAQEPPALQFRWDQAYVGIRAGSGDYTESSQHLDDELAADGSASSSARIEHHRFAGVLYAGVPFYRSLSLEAGFADLGTYPVSVTTTSTDIAQIAQTVVRDLSPAGRAVTLSLVAPLDLNRWLAIEPRLGVLGYDSRQELFTPLGRFSQNRSGVGADAGASLLIRAGRRWDLGVGVDCFDTNRDCNVLLLSAQAQFHFGQGSH